MAPTRPKVSVDAAMATPQRYPEEALLEIYKLEVRVPVYHSSELAVVAFYRRYGSGAGENDRWRRMD